MWNCCSLAVPGKKVSWESSNAYEPAHGVHNIQDHLLRTLGQFVIYSEGLNPHLPIYLEQQICSGRSYQGVPFTSVVMEKMVLLHVLGTRVGLWPSCQILWNMVRISGSLVQPERNTISCVLACHWWKGSTYTSQTFADRVYWYIWNTTS